MAVIGTAKERQAFGKRLRQAREGKAIAIDVAAREAGISPTTLRRWESGRTEPKSRRWILKLYQVLRPIDLEWLVCGAHKTAISRAISDNPRFSLRLKMAREVQGLSIEVAAKKAGISASKWRQWEDVENVKGGPNIDQFTAICNLLKPDPHWFIGDFKNAGKSFPFWTSQRGPLRPRR